MIMSGYSKKKGISIADTARILISAGCLNYLEEFYGTLHLLSNEDVISELADMTETETGK